MTFPAENGAGSPAERRAGNPAPDEHSNPHTKGEDVLFIQPCANGALRELIALIREVAPEYAESTVVANAEAVLAMGFRRIGTYTLARESGASLRAAGWIAIAEVKGRSWDTPSRRRTDKHPTEDKTLWQFGEEKAA